MARMVAPRPRGLAVPQTAALSGTLLLALTTLIGFLEKPPSVVSGPLAVAFLLLGAATGWWPQQAGIALAMLLTASLAVPAEDSFAMFAVLIPIVVLGLRAEDRRLRLLLAVWYFAGLVALIHLRSPGDETLSEDLSTVLFVLVLLIASWALGWAIHALGRMKEHAQRVAVRGVQVAVAQDLHDTVANSLSLIAMRSDQARLAGHSTSEDLAFIADQSRQAIQDLRGMLEMLRRDPEVDLSQEPTPWRIESLETTLAQRTASLEASGFSVSALTEGDFSTLPPSTDRTLSKVLHEALSNVEHHAEPGSHCSVLITIKPTTIEMAVVSVAQAGPLHHLTPHPGPRLGIIGMRERMESCHGTLEVGRVDDRWIVEATAPVSVTQTARVGGRP